MHARALILGMSLLSTTAFAQQVEAENGFDAHGFQLAAFDGDVRDLMWVHRPGRMTTGDWFFGGLLEYANAPLVKVVTNGAGERDSTAALNHIVALNMSGGVSVHDRVRIDLALPMHFASFDIDGGYQGVTLGDLRATAMVGIVRPDAEDKGFGLGVSLHMDVPTGAPTKFLGQRTIAGGGRVNATYGLENFTFTGELGAQFNPAIALDNLNNPDQLLVGLGAGYRINDNHGLNLEARVAPSLKKNTESGTETPSELGLSYRYRHDGGGHLLGGLAAGTSRGAGAARFRVFIGGGFGNIQRVDMSDVDGDGIVGSMDACPERPETVNMYMDEDGCPDSLAKLAVDVKYEGKGVKGAAVTIRDASDAEQSFTTDAAVPLLDAMPGSDWRGEASVDCLAGNAKTTVGDKRGDLVIEMQEVRDARVVFTVTDEKGNPVPDAKVRWQSDKYGCVPAIEELLEGGNGQQAVGLGEHVLNVEAPGYRIHRETLTVEGPAEYAVNITLVPTKVQVNDTEIRILEKVFFETNKAEIKGVSFALLDEVATVLLAYPKIKKVEVAGHTDSQGGDDYNLELSQRRADAVKAYLGTRGVAAERLVAVGYGESKPVADNGTSSGRDKNRRVEFQILTDEGDSPVQEAE